MVNHVVPVPIRRIIAKAVIEPSNKTFLCLVPPPDIIPPYLQYDKLCSIRETCLAGIETAEDVS